MENTHKKCPLCSGTGKVEKIIPIDDARTFAKKLREHGYSWRQIADAMGYKSHNAAKYLVESK